MATAENITQPEVRYAGLDGTQLITRNDVAEAIRRRLGQISGIAALLGQAPEFASNLPYHACDYAAWAIRDLAAEAEELTVLVEKMPQDPPPEPLTAI